MKATWLDSGSLIEPSELAEEGIYTRTLPTEPTRYQPDIDALKEKGRYVTQDVIALSPDTEGLEALCDRFKDEHLHTEDEVRFVLEGEGVFDIRSHQDRWMHVLVEPGDLIVVPEGRHHRFFLTDKKTIRCVRLFKDKSGWTPHYREPTTPT